MEVTLDTVFEKIKELLFKKDLPETQDMQGQEAALTEEPYKWYPNHERSSFAMIGSKGGKSKSRKSKKGKLNSSHVNLKQLGLLI